MPAFTFAEAFDQRFQMIVDDVALAVVTQAGGGYRQQQIEDFRPNAEQGMALFGRDLADGTLEHFAPYWLSRAPERVKTGYAIDSMLRSIILANEVVIRHLLPLYADDVAAAQAMIERVCAIADNAKLALFRAVAQAQQSEIELLSAPIIPIFSGVLVLPLIGAIDSRRAGMITAALLSSITERQAGIVLLDITGVPVFDTAVAQHLLQAGQAVRLLGAELVLVGIRPEIAQTIVQLGLSLTDITTWADLQAGFAYALERQGLAITPRLAARLKPARAFESPD